MAGKKHRAILDDSAAYGQAWAALSFAERRRISKAVNRGQAVDDGRDAEFVVMSGRRQMTFWRYAWIVGPAITLLQPRSELTVFLVSMVFIAAVSGSLSVFFFKRAKRAIALNLATAEESARKASRGRASKGGSAKGANKPHPKSQEAAALASAESPPGLLQRLLRR